MGYIQGYSAEIRLGSSEQDHRANARFRFLVKWLREPWKDRRLVLRKKRNRDHMAYRVDRKYGDA